MRSALTLKVAKVKDLSVSYHIYYRKYLPTIEILE